MGYFEGFGVTFRKLLHGADKGRIVTVEYPKQKRPKAVRLHGRHVLNRYEDGMEKCIGCELCAGVCPARCIYVRGADNPADDPVSPGERYGFVYEINYLRCIHCDLCVEACPTEAITESKLFEFSFTNRQDAIYTKTELVVENGICTGVIALQNGASVRIDARAVVIADGGFAANRQMVAQYITPRADRVLARVGPGANGDGIRLAEAVGAAIGGFGAFYGHVHHRAAMQNPKLWPYPHLDAVAEVALLIGPDGRRFTDEGLGGVCQANAIARKGELVCDNSAIKL